MGITIKYDGSDIISVKLERIIIVSIALLCSIFAYFKSIMRVPGDYANLREDLDRDLGFNSEGDVLFGTLNYAREIFMPLTALLICCVVLYLVDFRFNRSFNQMTSILIQIISVGYSFLIFLYFIIGRAFQTSDWDTNQGELFSGFRFLLASTVFLWYLVMLNHNRVRLLNAIAMKYFNQYLEPTEGIAAK